MNRSEPLVDNSQQIGYLHPNYAHSLAEFGQPVALPASGGCVLERNIPDSDLRDAMGCYPLFCCLDWTGLKDDFAMLAGRLVSVAAVIDPFAPVNGNDLSRWFQIVKPFKQHFVVDTQGPANHITKHHRYYSKKALKEVQVEQVTRPEAWASDWSSLYSVLVNRHELRGIKAFSASCFAVQLSLPGLVLFRAVRNGATVGMHLWFVQSDTAYSHLAACSEEGYTVGAQYALYSVAIQTFREQGLRWIDLGAGAGLGDTASDGLSQFKAGWSNSTKTKYFCGSVLDEDAYAKLSKKRGSDPSVGYFPTYRYGELR